MLQLNISQQDAQYQLHIHDSVLGLRISEPHLYISSAAATLEIQQRDSVIVDIDQTAFYNAVGLRSASEINHEGAQQALNHLQQNAGQLIRDGDRLSNLDTTLPRIAAEKTVSSPSLDVTLVSIPLPTIRCSPGELQISVQLGRLDITLQRGEVEPTGSMPRVDLQMLRYPSLTFHVSGSHVDMAV